MLRIGGTTDCHFHRYTYSVFTVVRRRSCCVFDGTTDCHSLQSPFLYRLLAPSILDYEVFLLEKRHSVTSVPRLQPIIIIGLDFVLIGKIIAKLK